jgi:hypothetical protein
VPIELNRSEPNNKSTRKKINKEHAEQNVQMYTHNNEKMKEWKYKKSKNVQITNNNCIIVHKKAQANKSKNLEEVQPVRYTPGSLVCPGRCASVENARLCRFSDFLRLVRLNYPPSGPSPLCFFFFLKSEIRLQFSKKTFSMRIIYRYMYIINYVYSPPWALILRRVQW